MMTALYSGATGMKAHDTGLSSVSNNLANVNTVGYKQQYVLFQDVMSQSLAPGASWQQNTNQLGLGVQVGANRTVFTEGAFEPGSAVTDMAIGGKGYFQVSDGKDTFYTRAGNFRFDQEGWLRTPGKMTVTGLTMKDGVLTGESGPIRIDPNDPTVSSSPAKATSAITAAFTLPQTAVDKSDDTDNPFFNLAGKWNGAVTGGVSVEATDSPTSPLPSSSYSEKQTLKVIDATGQSHELTMYMDGVSAEVTGAGTTYEYLLASDPMESVPADGIPNKQSGALMAGTITFSPSGDIVDMTGFVPTGTVPTPPEGEVANELLRWQPAPLVNGKPQFTVGFGGAEPQAVTLDLGISSSTNTRTNVPASAADVGSDPALLGSLENAVKGDRISKASAATTGSASTYLSQDGLTEGAYSNMEITPEGVVRINYSNSTSADLYTIPLYRFNSEDGLRREGGNLYAATEEAGEIQSGIPGTSNYGTLQSAQLETSNVDTAREMVSLIIMQRGFQMNSKSVTTADQLLQKAMELKRN